MQIRTEHTENSQLGRCFCNCIKQAQEHGGKAVLGWTPEPPMYKLVQPWMHHCVWEKPGGELVDITPQLNTRKQIEFPPVIEFRRDDTATLLEFDGKFRARLTQYTALQPTEKARKVIQCMEQADELMQAGDFDGEAFWLRQAAKLIHPDAYIGPKGMQYRGFDLPTR